MYDRKVGNTPHIYTVRRQSGGIIITNGRPGAGRFTCSSLPFLSDVQQDPFVMHADMRVGWKV
jgi:hypothetical protein